MPVTAILDIDGTLVDTNYQHAIAWYRAFRQNGVVLPTWRIHRHQGMGGDQLVPTLLGEKKAEEISDDVRAAEKERYAELIDEVEPMDGARDLIVRLKEMGHSVILASSAKEEEVDHYLDLLDARDLVDAWTTSADVEETKPKPDLVESAMDKGDAATAVMVGDSTFDVEAAERAGVKTVALLTGGFSDQELRDAGAVAVFESIRELIDNLEDTPLGG